MFNIFAPYIDCGYPLNRLGEAVLMSAHNLFWSKNEKKTCIPQFYYIKGCTLHGHDILMLLRKCLNYLKLLCIPSDMYY